MTKIINPDSLLWVFAPLSLLSYLIFLKRGTFRYLIFCGILLGLALLTKYVANILFVFFLGLIFLEYLYHPKQALIPFTLYLKKSLKHFILLTFAALATFYSLFPAVWIKPSKLLTSTLGSQAFEKGAPLLLVLNVPFLIIAPFFFFKRHFSESVALRTSFYLVVFTLLYYLGTTVNHVGAIVRYQIIIFPLAAIIAGITLEHSLMAIREKLSIKAMPTPVFVASLIILFGGLSLFTTPFPLSYASTMLSAKYSIDVKDMGAGSYEAAEFLNLLPDAENMLIWTDKDWVCKFFVGRCKRGRNYETLRRDGLDYIVVSAGRESRTTKMMGGDIVSNKPGLIRFDAYYAIPNT